MKKLISSALVIFIIITICYSFVIPYLKDVRLSEEKKVIRLIEYRVKLDETKIPLLKVFKDTASTKSWIKFYKDTQIQFNEIKKFKIQYGIHADYNSSLETIVSNKLDSLYKVSNSKLKSN